MPDYYNPDLKAGTIPQKPRDMDESVGNFSKNEKAAQQANRDEGAAHDERQRDRREAAGRQAEAKKQPGPAEKLYGMDRMVNTDGRRRPERSSQKPELTEAQRDMRAKREEARAADLKQLTRPYDDKKYVELPKKPPTIDR